MSARPARRRRRRALARTMLVLGLVLAAGGTVASAAHLAAEPAVATPAAATPAAAIRVPAPVPPAPQTTAPSPSETVAPSVAPVASPAPGRRPTAEDPLRVWIAGDSMWELAGPILAAQLEATGVVTANVDFHYSTGLTRPDVLDWPARASEVVARDDPELVVVLIGANDSQRLVDGDRILDPDGEAFAEVYAGRVRDLMARLTRGGAHVVWVGLPIMRPTGYDAAMQRLADIQAHVAATMPDVTFVATRALFADEHGAYASVLPGADGSPVALRGSDGIHLLRGGAERLVARLRDVIAARGLLPA